MTIHRERVLSGQQDRGAGGAPCRQLGLRLRCISQWIALTDSHVELAADDHLEQLIGHALQVLGIVGVGRQGRPGHVQRTFRCREFPD